MHSLFLHKRTKYDLQQLWQCTRQEMMPCAKTKGSYSNSAPQHQQQNSTPSCCTEEHMQEYVRLWYVWDSMFVNSKTKKQIGRWDIWYHTAHEGSLLAVDSHEMQSP